VLLAVDHEGDRRHDDLPTQTRAPEHGAGSRIERREVSLASSGEEEVRRRREEAESLTSNCRYFHLTSPLAGSIASTEMWPTSSVQVLIGPRRPMPIVGAPGDGATT
jgi:hypothetical protein